MEVGEIDHYLTARQVAELFRVSTKTIARWAKDGKLPHTVTLGGHRRYSEREMLGMLRDRRK